jgi:hypothetical protein
MPLKHLLDVARLQGFFGDPANNVLDVVPTLLADESRDESAPDSTRTCGRLQG